MENANKLWTVDAHCHWSDERVFAQAPQELNNLIASGVRAFQLGGVDPADWTRQQQLQAQFPNQVFTAFGLHPYFVASQSPAALESAWIKLKVLAPNADALGEQGLDFRKRFSQRDIQIEYFQRQLKLANDLQKPAVLHIVRAHEEALQELRETAPAQGMVHAFTAGPTVAKKYLDLGLSLSIGAKLLHPETEELQKSVRLAPLSHLLVESDCPDQPPPNQMAHDSRTVWLVLERISQLKMLPLLTVVEQTRANLFTMIKKEFRP